MLLRLYRWLLRLYPARYRFTFGREMVAVFQQRRADAWSKGAFFRITFCIREIAGLVPAALRERARAVGYSASGQGFTEQRAVAGAGPALDGVPVFYTSENYSPRRIALVHGAILSLLLFSAVTAAYEQGVNRNTFRKILRSSSADNRREYVESNESGFAAFSRSLVRSADSGLTMTLGKRPATIDIVKPKRVHWAGLWSNLVWLLRVRPHLSFAAPRAPESETREEPDPWRDYASTYFRVILALRVLDTDHDYVISAAEIANAP